MKRPRQRSSFRHEIPAPHGSLLYVVDAGLFELGLVQSIACQFGEPFHYVSELSEVIQHLRFQPLPVDVVVVDLTLQGGDPAATIDLVRQEPAASGIVVLQASVTEEETEATVSFDVYAHTPRPTRLGSFELAIAPEGAGTG